MSLASMPSCSPTHKTEKRSLPETTFEHDSLHELGYKVYKAAVTIPEPVLQEIVRKYENGGAIFNHNEHNKNDHKRRQSNISASKCSKAMKDFLDGLNEFLSENVSSSLRIAPWVVLHSRPECQDQAAHCDYVPDADLARASDEQMPLAALVALMPGTRLNVWPRSCRLSYLSSAVQEQIAPIHCKVEKLEPGDVLVFRGDFVHAGSSYSEDNYRLHTFLDSNSVTRQPNKTWLVHTHGTDSIKKVIIPK